MNRWRARKKRTKTNQPGEKDSLLSDGEHTIPERPGDDCLRGIPSDVSMITARVINTGLSRAPLKSLGARGRNSTKRKSAKALPEGEPSFTILPSGKRRGGKLIQEKKEGLVYALGLSSPPFPNKGRL